MKMIYHIAVALSLTAIASAKLYTDDHAEQKKMWESFKVAHNRNYGTMEEETSRFNYFLENLRMADIRTEQERKAGGTAIHGVTKFSDLSQAEFEAQYLTVNMDKKNKAPVGTMTGVKPLSGKAQLTDWTGIYTTPVKDQVIF